MSETTQEPSRWERTSKCECGGTVVSHGGMTEEGERWGGNCKRCGKGYGEYSDARVEATPEPTGRARVKVIHLGSQQRLCQKCPSTDFTALVREPVTTRKGEGVYRDTPLVTLEQAFMRCARCGDEWMTEEQASAFEKQLSTKTFHEYRAITAHTQRALTGVASLLGEAYEHWDAGNDAKVGKILNALTGSLPKYDARADAFRAALSTEPRNGTL